MAEVLNFYISLIFGCPCSQEVRYYRRPVFEHNQLHCWLSPVHETGLGDICFLIMDGLIYVVNQDDSHMDFLSLLSSIRSQGSKTLTLS